MHVKEPMIRKDPDGPHKGLSVEIESQVLHLFLPQGKKGTRYFILLVKHVYRSYTCSYHKERYQVFPLVKKHVQGAS